MLSGPSQQQIIINWKLRFWYNGYHAHKHEGCHFVSVFVSKYLDPLKHISLVHYSAECDIFCIPSFWLYTCVTCRSLDLQEEKRWRISRLLRHHLFALSHVLALFLFDCRYAFTCTFVQCALLTACQNYFAWTSMILLHNSPSAWRF